MTQITGWVGFDEPRPSLKVKFLPLRDPNGQEMESFRSQSARVAAVLCDTYASPVKMANVEAPVAVVYDGALDNLKRLQSALAEIGEGSSRSRAPEIVLRGYMSWGGAVVGWLQGPFALALWDGRADGRLLLARDPLGLKPLYYWEDLGRGLLFASNLKTLLTLDVPREIDPIALSSYLEHGHPSPRQSLIQGCRQVLPGHLLIWEKGRLSESASGDGPENLFLSAPARMADPSLQAWLTDTVLKQLAPDVPVGVLLSGGVKSDLLLSITSSLLGKRVHTFTALCGPVNFPESENARRTALSLGCRHHPLIISPRAGRLLPFIVSHMDEPLADPLALTSYVVCRWASEEVRLPLAGEGPEDFWSPYPAELGSAKPVLARLLADFPEFMFFQRHHVGSPTKVY